jgi:hypothetical protein
MSDVHQRCPYHNSLLSPACLLPLLLMPQYRQHPLRLFRHTMTACERQYHHWPKPSHRFAHLPPTRPHATASPASATQHSFRTVISWTVLGLRSQGGTVKRLEEPCEQWRLIYSTTNYRVAVAFSMCRELQSSASETWISKSVIHQRGHGPAGLSLPDRARLRHLLSQQPGRDAGWHPGAWQLMRSSYHVS